MSIDNGRQRRLIVPGVFDGIAGESEGLLAFIPDRNGKPARYARLGTLDGEQVALSYVAENKPFVTFRYGPSA